MPRRLPLRKILWGAFALPWQNRAEVARAGGLPILGVIAVTLLWDILAVGSTGAAQWTLYFLYSVALSWLAVSIHRVVLLAASDSHTRADSRGLKRLGLFIAVLIGLYALYIGIVLGMVNLMLLPFARYVPVDGAPGAPDISFQWFVNVALVIAIWPIARLSLLFPVIAVDGSLNPLAAWRQSRGNGWKLVIIVGLLPYTLKGIVALLSRADGTMWEFGVLLVLTSIFTVIQVVALSLSYWELTQPEPPPTPPPA